MKKLLVVVDMQNDFITGALENKEGQMIVDKLADYIRDFDGDIIATRDTHTEDYMATQEGKKLPVPHCIRGTEGWNIVPAVQAALDKKAETASVRYIDKPTFGSCKLGETVAAEAYTDVELCGVCTDICVISNALLIKAYAVETKVSVLKQLCAGVTPESHNNALNAMAACQVDIVPAE